MVRGQGDFQAPLLISANFDVRALLPKPVLLKVGRLGTSENSFFVLLFMERPYVGVRPAAFLPVWAALCPFFIWGTLKAEALDGARVRGEVRSVLQAEGQVVVFVNFKSPGPPVDTSSTWTARDPDATQSYMDALAVSSLDLERSLMEAGRVNVRYRFTWFPVLVVEIEDVSVLEALDRMDQVDSVHLDFRGSGQLFESASYIRAPEARDLGVSGEGTVVA